MLNSALPFPGWPALPLWLFVVSIAAAEEPLNYERDISPLLRKYCQACHNEDDREGGLAVDSFAALLKGGDSGAVLAPHRPEASRLIRVLTGEAEPRMPPKGSPVPLVHEVARLRRWIESGASGPEGHTVAAQLPATPKFHPTAPVRNPITDLAVFRGGDWLVARYGEATLIKPGDLEKVETLLGVERSITRVAVSRDGRRFALAGGEPGLTGAIEVWNVGERRCTWRAEGHGDAVYAAAFSAQGDVLATGGYDHKIVLWRAETGEPLRELSGHNGPVLALNFCPVADLLASTGADRTIRLWKFPEGKRVETLTEPTEEQRALVFDPTGRFLAAAGADRRIRLWQLDPALREGHSVLLETRFAHRSPILRLAFSPDGSLLASSGEDRLVKLWSVPHLRPIAALPEQPDWVTALAFHGGDSLALGRHDGSLAHVPLPNREVVEEDSGRWRPLPTTDRGPEVAREELPELAENEPNDAPQSAQRLHVPGVVRGTIGAAGDLDYYRFRAASGQSYVLETRAAADGSPLDTAIEVLDSDGRSIPRVWLRAVRDSNITFRPIDSKTLDCRVVNWEEMELNQYLYMNGEVVKIFRMPRGPDSGFLFYPGQGERHTFFDTSPTTHALEEPCYVVEPWLPGSDSPENGLPVFPVSYANDDDPLCRLGSDSRLNFIAPDDGEYLVRVRDSRGFGGEKFTYRLIIRRPEPKFQLTIDQKELAVPAGAARGFTVKAERIDGFDQAIELEVRGLPPGWEVSRPLVIEPEHLETRGVLLAPLASQDSVPSEYDDLLLEGVSVAGRGRVGGRLWESEPRKLQVKRVKSEEKLAVHLDPLGAESERGFIQLVAGGSTTCRLRLSRQGFQERVPLEVENLPHGVIVDDIGLNGVLIPPGETERVIVLRSAAWVEPTERPVHATATVAGNPVSAPIRLRILANQTTQGTE